MTGNRGAFMTSQRGTFRTGYETSTPLRHNTFYHGGGLCLSSRYAYPQPLVHYALPTRLTAMTQRPANVHRSPALLRHIAQGGGILSPPLRDFRRAAQPRKSGKMRIPSDGRRAFLHIHGALRRRVPATFRHARLAHALSLFGAFSSYTRTAAAV